MLQKRPWLIVSLLLGLGQAALLVDSAYELSNTNDEGSYIGRGAYQWNGYFSCTPPLPQWGFALGLRAVDSQLLQVPRGVTDQTPAETALYKQPFASFRRDLVAARFASILIVVASGWFLWAAARRFGSWVAVIAHALWCFSPLVLASGPLATLDAWSAAATCLILWSAVRFVECPTPGRGAGVGAALAIGAASKFTLLAAAPVLLVVALFALWTPDWRAAIQRAWRALTAAGAGFLLVLWALYGFSLAPLGVDGMCQKAKALPHLPSVMLPFPEFIEGILLQFRHGYDVGHAGYLFGELSSRGWWWFYLAAMALQTTLAAQALAGFRLVSWVIKRPARAELLIDTALLAFPALLFVLLSAGRAQNGLKYLLPIFPCLMLWGARALIDAERLLGPPRRRLALGGVASTVALGALSAVSAHPHYLMFFNLWAGGPERGPRYLIHGNDWGQDVKRLAAWQAEHGVDQLFFLPYVEGATLWGVRYAIPPCEPAPGVYALHAIHAHRPYDQWRGCWDWLTLEPPDERVGYTIYVYRVDEARLDRLAEERGRSVPFVHTGPPW